MIQSNQLIQIVTSQAVIMGILHSSVAGGVMAVFLVVAVAVYCYRQHVGSTNHSLYTPASLQPRPSIYQSQPAHDIDTGDDDLLGEQTTAHVIIPFCIPFFSSSFTSALFCILRFTFASFRCMWCWCWGCCSCQSLPHEPRLPAAPRRG